MRGQNEGDEGNQESELLEIRMVDPLLPEVIDMLWEMRREIDRMYDEVTTSPPPQEEFLSPRAVFLAVTSNGRMVGCGAIKPFDGETAEIKRLFVSPAYRRKGIARWIMQELERKATELRYRQTILDTGYKQQGAMRLYESLGYRRIPCAGRQGMKEWSVCFEKRL
ncbi:MAG: GNAT family N-acetyltransferase [Methanomassiliicoccales archaeon]|nr:GNAT family N-acetyltransferase [Methanomassiliicoccales archaeon]